MKQLGRLMALLVIAPLACAFAADPGTIQDVHVAAEGGTVRVQITLSAPSTPTVTTAVHPDRLVVELPNVVSNARQTYIAVNQPGVRSVRFGLNSATPAVTRVVIDLDQMQPYSLSTNGNRIVLSITASAAVGKSSARRGALPAASSGTLTGIFHKAPSQPEHQAEREAAPLPASPPPGTGPSWQPPRNNDGTDVSIAASSNPNAQHPNLGSLQQGTVVPGAAVSATNPPSGTPGTTPVFDEVAVVHGQDSNAQSATQIPALSASSQPASTAPAPAITHPQPAIANSEATGETSPAAVAIPAPAPKNEVGSKDAAQISLAASITSATQGTKAAANNSSEPKSAAPPSGNAVSLAREPAPVADTGSSTSQTVEKAPAEKPVVVDVANTTAAETPAPSNPEPGKTAAPHGNWPAPGSIPLAPIEPEPETPDPALAAATRTQSDLHTFFRVKYVTEGAAYLEGGRVNGLAGGMHLVVRDDGIKVTSDDPSAPDPRVTAQLEIVSVAETSTVTEIKSSTRAVKVGDLAWLSAEDEAALVQERTLSPTRKYPVVISFTENGDPMDEEVRAEVPRPPLPEINRARGRIGIDYNTIMGTGSPSYSSTQLGLVMRTDITRINGTYWNLSGYWRGRISSRSSSGQPTLQDLLNRTYHLSMTYDNPSSPWVMGFGRMYLPWATSLDTIDGGYFGRKLKQGVTAGFFGGSTPDPTSWNYALGRRIAGGFINFQGGSYNDFHYFTTVGGAASTINGQFDRPFVFVENSLFYKRYLSFYSSIQADHPPANPAVPSPGTGLARSFLTLRIQPHERIGFDFNYNYLRDIPSYDPSLLSTGLLDKYLFQGFSAGMRVEPIRKITLYTNLGRSNRSGDKQSSLNQLYGLTYSNIWHTGLRADMHYSIFNSSFGKGSYEAFSMARNVMEGSRLEVQVGKQMFTSSNATVSNSRFLNAIFEMNIGRHYFLQSGFTFNRGSSQNYNQWNIGMGYRFDNREKKRQ